MSIRLLRILAIGAFVVAAMNVFSALQHVGKPHPGFMPFYQLVFMNSAKGFEVYDKVETANGGKLRSNSDLIRLVTSLPLGTTVKYGYRHEGKLEAFEAKTKIFGWRDFAKEFLGCLLVGIAYLLVGSVAFFLKPNHPATRAHLILTVALGLGHLEPYCLSRRDCLCDGPSQALRHRPGDQALGLLLGRRRGACRALLPGGGHFPPWSRKGLRRIGIGSRILPE